MKSLVLATGAALLFLSPSFSSAAAAPKVARSYNWSGYVAKGGSYTHIAGSWTVAPGTTTGNALTANAAWIGIGGFDGTSNLIQTGTRTLEWNGQVTYQAWYELIPAPPVPFSVTVGPNDTVSASISETSKNVWTITFTNVTSGESAAVRVPYVSHKSSAEWIVERPSSSGTLVALTPFNAFVFSGLSAVKNGKAVTPVTAAAKKLLLIERNGTTLLTPSALGKNGRSFTIARNASDTLGIPRLLARR